MSDLYLYNTLGRKKEKFEPLEKGHVRMYVCGPTVYSSAHLGHARPAVVFDVLRRYLEFSGHKVTLVTNFTDVDDKIIKRAHEEKSTEKDISDKYIAEYFEDMDAMNIRRADVYPKATEHIQDMIELIRVLEKKGYAYKVGEGDVFFDVTKFKGYGRLSGRTLDQIKEARVEPDPRKKNPADFALWKAGKPGDPVWDTPWGKGRPGWHIECSAMSGKYLGPLPFDIHGGGQDLIFPHHENEKAQSEAAYGKPMAQFWLHNGFINMNKEKMSKSLGNVFNLREAYKEYGWAVLRYFILGTHYRTDLNFTPEILNQAKESLERIYNALERAIDLIGPMSDANYDDRFRYISEFKKAMDDDLNTPVVLSIVIGSITLDINSRLKALPKEDTKENVRMAVVALRQILEVLGLPGTREEALAESHKVADGEGGDAEGKLLDVIGEIRAMARKEKVFAISDFIRDRLGQLGYELRDLPGGKWEVKRRL